MKKKYEHYKNTNIEWLGELPEHWLVRPLRYAASIQNGSDFKAFEVEEGGYPVLGSGGEFARISKFIYDKPSVLLGRKGTIDKPIYCELPFWTVDTLFYTKIAEDTYPKFFYWFCTLIPFEYFQYGSAVPSMTQSDFYNIQMSMPPFEEQVIIAKFLDYETTKIDNLINEQKHLIELLKEKRQALISHAVTKGLNPNIPMEDSGVEWLGEVPLHWKIKKIKWLFKIKKHIAGTLGYDILSITQQGIRIKDIESGDGQLSMDYSKYQIVQPGDFAMNHMDLLTGYVDIATTLGVTSPDYRVISLKDRDSSYDRYYLYLFQMGYKNKIFFAYGQGSSQLGRWRFPTEQFNDFIFPVPPYEEQQAIASFLIQETSKVDKLIIESERSIELLKERRTALISAVVTGKLDVREFAENFNEEAA